jgi:hypothetical protein
LPLDLLIEEVPMTQHHSDERPDVLTPTEARQGRLGWPVLYMLLGGLALALIAWAVIGAWY